MGTISTVVIIATFLGLLWLVAGRLRGLFSRHVIHSDIAIRREESNRFGIANVRLAYAGNTPLIIENVRFRARLTIPGRRNQIKLWMLVATAYLTGDWQGIVAIEGPLLPTRRPRLRRALLFVIGIVKLVYVVLFLVNPILLIGLLLIGPPEELKVLLVADDKNMDIRDVDANGDYRRPFLVKPYSIRNFVMKYEVRAKKQFGVSTRFFRSRVSVAYVDDAAGHVQLKWQLPSPGQLVWESRENLEVWIRGRLLSYSLNAREGRKFVTIA